MFVEALEYKKVEIKATMGDWTRNYMANNSIQNKRIEISDGHLRYVEKKEYSPLTFSYIETCLSQVIKNSDQVEYIMKYIKENREVKTSMDIRRNNDVK